VADEPDNALRAVEEGIVLFHQHRDLLCAPDLYLFKGQALLALGERESAVTDAYASALALARTLGAKVCELRAASSAAHLLLRQGCREEALHLLAPIYAGFDQGHDSPDLRAAAVLLELLTLPG